MPSIRGAAILAVLFALWAPVGALASIPRSSPASSVPPSSVNLSIASDGTDTVNTSLTLIADLGPDAAYGNVALYDGSSQIASASNYRIRWSWSTTHLDPGLHHFTVDFTPAAASGYAPSTGSVDWNVPLAPSPAASVTKTKDPQPVTVTIPSVKPTKTKTHHPHPTPKPKPTHTKKSKPNPGVSVEPTQATQGRGGALPMTGFDVVWLGAVSLLMLALGGLVVRIARRRRT